MAEDKPNHLIFPDELEPQERSSIKPIEEGSLKVEKTSEVATLKIENEKKINLTIPANESPEEKKETIATPSKPEVNKEASPESAEKPNLPTKGTSELTEEMQNRTNKDLENLKNTEAAELAARQGNFEKLEELIRPEQK